MKKNLICLFLIVVISKQAFAQLTYIPDPVFAGFLQAAFPSAMIYPDSLDPNNSAVTSTTSLYCSSLGISDLTGITAFVNLTMLECEGNSLTSLPALPASLQGLFCGGNSLSSLPALPGTLNHLECGGNPLNTLPALPGSLQHLRCNGNNLSALPVLPGSLQILYCGGNSLTTLSGLPASLQVLSCSNNNPLTITSLPASLSELYCSSSGLTSLPVLPAGLASLECSMNSISQLPVLPSSLVELYCRNNGLTSLPNLPSSLHNLDCGDNLLTSLPPLPASLYALTCDYNTSISFPASFPASLGELNISGDPSTPFPSLPASLSYFECNSMSPPLTSLPTLPSGLISLQAHSNALTSLPQLPPTLQQLYIHTNNLNFLPQPLPQSLSYLNLVNNPINCIPQLPQGFETFYGDFNYDCLFNHPPNCGNCLPYQTCSPAYNCNGFSYVSGVVFNDLNNDGSLNGVEPGRAKVYLYSDNGNFSAECDANGNYYLPADTGILFTVQAQIPPYRQLTTTPASHIFSNYGLIDSLNQIGIYDVPNINDLAVSLTDYGEIRPGFNYHSLVTFDNPGTTIQSGQLYFVKPSLTTLVTATPAPSVVSGDTLTWTFTNSQPLSPTVNYNIELNIPSTTILGTIIHSSAGVSYAAADFTPDNNLASDSDIIGGSFDPNDKQAIPENTFTTVQLANGEYMTYTIRFQNTGTASAFNVVILDTLATEFDLTTFQVVGASHAYTWKIENRVLTVRFDNIMLPDSNTNESLSHGFVRYKVKPNALLAVGTAMNNTAYIYFDFNSPVQTNTTNTVVIVPQGISPAMQNSSFSVYPNPANEELSVSFMEKPAYTPVYEIYDLTGRIVLTGNVTDKKQHINLRSLQNGMYIIKITCGDRSYQNRFVKQ